MRAFNAFQLAVLFALWPFIIEWLHRATFVGATAALWVAIVAYIVHFGAACAAFHQFIGDSR